MRIFHLLILALLLIGIGPSTILVAKEHSPTPHHLPDRRGTEEQPLVIKALPTLTPAEQTQRDVEQAKQRARDEADRSRELTLARDTYMVTTVVGVLTLIILTVQAIAFWRQTHALQHSVKEMKAATAVAQSAADSAKTAADAAVLSNTLNRDALIADQRPWIAIRAVPAITGIERENDGWRIAVLVNIQNTGKTPAHNVHVYGQVIAAVPGQHLEVDQAHAKLRNDALLFAHLSYGDLLFPGEPPRVIEGKALLPDRYLAPFHAQGINEYPVTISGCVYYTAPGFPEPRLTTFLVGVKQKAGGNVALKPGAPSGTQIFATDLITTRVKTGWWAD